MTIAVYVGFVRAVMIGREGLDRETLLDIVRRAGGKQPASHLATGNVSFSCAPDQLTRVVERIEAGIGDVVQRPTPVFVRSVDHLIELVDRDPFSEAPHPNPKARLVAMVRHVVPVDFEVPIVSPNGDFHVFAASGGDVFSITIDTGGRVENPGGLIERLVRQPLTSRAIGTIETIVARLR